MEFFETSASTSSNINEVGHGGGGGGCTKEPVCHVRNVHKHFGELSRYILIYYPCLSLPPSFSPSPAWQNWCCRLTRETWTACWDLWMTIWRGPLWKKRRAVKMPPTLRGLAPVRETAIISATAQTAAKDTCSPHCDLTQHWSQEGARLASRFCKSMKLHGGKCS